MITIAEITFSPVGIITSLVVGLVAGCLATWLMTGGGYGRVGDMIVGVVGAVIGGLALALIMNGEPGFWGTFVMAVVGAWMLLVMLRFLGFGRHGT